MLFKNKTIILGILTSLLFSGCASVEMAKNDDKIDAIKKLNQPIEDKAGLYVYRDSSFGGSLKKDIWINHECLGESAPKVFFFKELPSGEYKIATESEFSPNIISLNMESGKNYFIRQYIKMGVFVGGANLEQVSEEKGKQAISKLKMAKSGNCSKPSPIK